MATSKHAAADCKSAQPISLALRNTRVQTDHISRQPKTLVLLANAMLTCQSTGRPDVTEVKNRQRYWKAAGGFVEKSGISLVQVVKVDIQHK